VWCHRAAWHGNRLASSTVLGGTVGTKKKRHDKQMAVTYIINCVVLLKSGIVSECGVAWRLGMVTAWIRDMLFWFASLAGVRAQKEKAGLLPVRPGDETLRGDRLFQSRRPADVWRPSGLSSKPCAVDFAVTSGLRSAILRRTCADPSFISADFEELKRQHADTKTQCDAQGFDFAPFVIEAHGGVGCPVARRVCVCVLWSRRRLTHISEMRSKGKRWIWFGASQARFSEKMPGPSSAGCPPPSFISPVPTLTLGRRMAARTHGSNPALCI
jgi:hypothetical protein